MFQTYDVIPRSYVKSLREGRARRSVSSKLVIIRYLGVEVDDAMEIAEKIDIAADTTIQPQSTARFASPTMKLLDFRL